MVQYTVTFTKPVEGTLKSEPVFKKIISENYILSELIALNVVPDSLDFNLTWHNAISGFDAFSKRSNSLLYSFNIDRLSDYIIENYATERVDTLLNNQLWEKSDELMNIFNSKEFFIDFDNYNSKCQSEFTVSIYTWIEQGSINIVFKQRIEESLLMIDTKTLIKQIKKVNSILDEIVLSIKQEIRQSAHIHQTKLKVARTKKSVQN